MPTPVDIQIALFSKVLMFERNLMSQNDDTLAIGVLYQNSDSQSLTAQKDLRNFLDRLPQFKKAPFRYSLINIDATTDLASIIARERIKLLYVAPCPKVDFKVVADISRQYRVITLTGVPTYVDAGIGVGIEIFDCRPRLVLNLTSLRACGADFSAQLLNLARVIG
ncbi:MAG: DUF4154 domain-containing protein [candidate division Zixibacteria bacterium]|nr:DUF4154 domain-containing protein [candidate division Zixibacteria bacterium]